MTQNVIYKPSGAAGEYSRWACNLYRGCRHRCAYCYNRRRFRDILGPDKPVLQKKTGRNEEQAFSRFCAELDGSLQDIIAGGGLFFSFVSDPMLPETIRLTMRCAGYAMEQGCPVQILTKATWWTQSAIMLELFYFRSLIKVGFSLTGHDELEPGAPTNAERVSALRRLAGMGIPVFASIEPVVDFASSLTVILDIVDLCTDIRIGLLSPFDKERYDWHECDRFVRYVKTLAKERGVDVLWKHSIEKFYNEGKPV